MAATLGHFEKSAKYIKEEQGETLFLLKKIEAQPHTNRNQP